MKLQGKVTNGFGTGRIYVELYQDFFEKNIGFRCYPGTLNVEVPNQVSLPTKKMGDVDCYPILLNKVHKAVLVRPHKTSHPNTIIEIVSQEKLPYKNGDEIICELV